MKIVQNLNLKSYNSYQVDAIAEQAYFPESIDDIILFLKENSHKEIVLLGGGYNVILSKPIYSEKVFLILSSNFSKFNVSKNIIYAQSGVKLKQLSEAAYEHGLKGLEYFLDIPGTLGGGIVMNAGSKGEDIGSLINWVQFYDIQKKELVKLTKSQLTFSYRQSIFQHVEDFIILDAELQLDAGVKEDIHAKMIKNFAARVEKQPKGYPNAGSVFKRPDGYFVGQMVEDLGLKGLRVGDAMVSTKHAGFIINVGNAKGADIVQLIEAIQAKVYDHYGVHLEVEQRII